MGTIVARRRKDNSTGYTAQIVIKRKGLVYREAQTFDRRQAANAWMVRREAELAQPGALDRGEDPLLSEAIDRYLAESKKKIGRTKAQVLRTIKTFDIASMRCSKIGSTDIVAMAQGINAKPQTVQNYLSHLSPVFAIARPAWNYPLREEAMRDALKVLKRLGATAKSKSRERRPTLEELDRLMEHFGRVKAKRPGSIPMQRIVAFAIFSTRRQEEIVRLARTDLDVAGGRCLVRAMKHPGDKEGNDTWCDLVPEAMRVAQAMPESGARLFPFTTDAIGAAFTRACKLLGIEDLRFHDLRHEGVSRLFEMGWTIPKVASVSGHRSWASLKRYTHLRQTGDKYANWKWLDLVTGS